MEILKSASLVWHLTSLFASSLLFSYKKKLIIFFNISRDCNVTGIDRVKND